MLHDFLTRHREEILELCKEKVFAARDSRETTALLERGLPVFYDELIEVLKRSTGEDSVVATACSDGGNDLKGAVAHGRESLRLGYTISQVVHAYGAVCQSITELVKGKSFTITPQEFHDLNLCLDHAIAEAVTEFHQGRSENVSRIENERLGCLIHELGNSLAAASAAYAMIQGGHVGSRGSTSRVLGLAHKRMGFLIDRTMEEVRLRSRHGFATRSQVSLTDIMSEVEEAAVIMKSNNRVRLTMDVDSDLQLTANRHLVFSAVSNLVSNAMKFTKEGGQVSVRAKESGGGRILIEVEDECGGLPEGRAEELLEPFVQEGADKSGLGLGLFLSRQAIELNQGTLGARSIAGRGCVFTIDFPSGGHQPLAPVS